MRIEFIGDEVTAGYGADGRDETCRFSSATEDSSASHAFIAGELLDAEVVTVASSGVGASRNANAYGANTMPLLWTRTLPLDGHNAWDFSRWTPDAVVVELGYNDFAAGDPARRSSSHMSSCSRTSARVTRRR